MILPSRRTFRTLARSGERVPVAATCSLEASAQTLFEAVRFASPSALLESARTHPATGRYSILVGEPTESLTSKGNEIWLESEGKTTCLQGNPLEVLQTRLKTHAAVKIKGFPPFVGGAVGFFSFDLYRLLEGMPGQAQDDLGLPDSGWIFCDQAIVLDHLLKKLWVVVLADPKDNPDAAYAQAIARIDQLSERLKRSPEPFSILKQGFKENLPVQSTHTRPSFEAMVRQAKAFIAQGEIYQANLSQRFSMPLSSDPWSLYQRLTSVNPSPFAAFADFPALNPEGEVLQVISASPERLLRVVDEQAQTRPIAGTRPRGKTLEETNRLRRELILNEKERAEHLMLVDLERNDLGRLCQYGSVRVDESMVLEEYSHVIHIVSNVQGKLRSGVQIQDLIPAVFPGGTISGCPKIRSLEIIDALEPVRRHLYTGALGYFSATGDLDLNLLIRTAFVTGNQAYLQTGAGIVADSDPGREYEETLHKAQALMETFGGSRIVDSKLETAEHPTSL